MVLRPSISNGLLAHLCFLPYFTKCTTNDLQLILFKGAVSVTPLFCFFTSEDDKLNCMKVD